MPIAPQALNRSRSQREARIQEVPAPVGGWNARDSLSRMEPTDAVVLDNWFPDQGEVRVRGGYTEYATGLGGNVELLAEYHAGATRTFLAAANGAFWDVTNTGTAAKLASGFSSNRWQWTSFNGRTAFVNGSDAPQQYAGSAISALSITASAVATVANFIGVTTHKNRSYFWPDNSQDFYYSAVNALGGSLTRFPLSRVGQFGGNLLTASSWTRDGGDGTESLMVFVMTSGEVIVYQGSDPGSATDWALVGVFDLPRPIAQRAIVRFGGDLVIATEQGYFPLSAAFSGRVSRNAAVSDRISGAVRDAAQSYGSNYGWEAIFHPESNWLLFNVPVTTNTTYNQHVMNTVTGAWTRFKGMNARTWGEYDGELYFGGNGVVYKANDSAADDGNDITSEAQPAYTFLSSRSIRKQLTALQPVFSSDGDVNFEVSVASDFGSPSGTSPDRTATTAGAEWDTAEWDLAEWSGGLFIVNRWRVVASIGYSFGVRFGVRTNGVELQWFSINYWFKPAGIV